MAAVSPDGDGWQDEEIRAKEVQERLHLRDAALAEKLAR